jgi:SPP1 family predicted phage head-tail adaptor
MKQLGKMDRRLTLKHRVLAASDANGQKIESFTEYAEVWGKKFEVNGREFQQSQTKDAEITTRFEIRYRTDVVATDRIVCGGLDYQLIQPPTEIGRQDGLILFARAVNNG